jgi:hypothetical protein
MTDRLDIQLEFKDRVIGKVLLATINRPVDARSIWAEWNIDGRYSISIEGWQRIVTKMIETYQHEQFEKAKEGKKSNMVMSSGKGYYCCHSEEDAFAGIAFYYERMFPMFKRRKFYKEFTKLVFNKNIDRLEHPGQVNLFS